MPDRLARLIEELKRRGVLRVAAVYLVAAWVAIQVSDVTFPRLGLPDAAVTFVIVLLAALFPVAIGLSWAFDVRRTGRSHGPDTGADVADDAAMIVPGRVRARVPITLAALMTVPLVAFGVWWVNDARGAELDTHLVAVMPFRVAGASTELTYLREGLMDLIAARVGSSGEGVRVVEPRTVSRLIRDEMGSPDADPDREEAMDLAIDLGAGRLLQGEVIRTGRNVTVTATLYDVTSNRVLATQPFPPVSADSLHALVDAIATQLIAAESGVRADRLASITTRSVPALRAFIEAEHAFRRGEHARAVEAYDHAVQLDTTFALAALGLIRSRGWSIGTMPRTPGDLARRIVRRGVDRLGEADRAFFDVMDRRPGEFERDRFERARLAVERHPDQADLRYLVGDRLLHYGSWIGIEDAVERGRVELERVVAMDSTYGEPLIHLYELAITRDDTAGMRRYGALLVALDSTGPYATKVRYVRSLGLDGTRGAAPVRLDTLPIEHLAPLAQLGWSQPPRRELVEANLSRFRATTLPDEQRTLAGRVVVGAVRGGQPSLLDEVDEKVGGNPWIDVDLMLAAIYWQRDDALAAQHAEAVRRRMVELRAAGDSTLLEWAEIRRCFLGHYAAARGEVGELRRIADELEAAASARDDGWIEMELRTCAMFVRAAAAVHARDPESRRLLGAFDEHLLRGPDIDDFGGPLFQLGSARLWESIGERERALAVVRRRLNVPFAQMWINELNGEQARLADALGYREEAIRLYRTYLAYFHAPEPPFTERVERARARLTALVGEN
ncbi:MAG TPA: hypothetical protein VF039_01100 [Longimicrobiales bacterium]